MAFVTKRPMSRVVSLASAVALSLAVMVPLAAPATATPQAASSNQWIKPTNYKFPGNDGKKHKITWDRYSYKIDGQRLNIWSGEVHYWRLPSPQTWRDILQKMKANGFNAVSFYFFWGYHQSHSGGPIDFTGIRDVDLLLKMAAEEGLYVIARPGPYINAEVSMGGMPAWQSRQRTPTRTLWDAQSWKEQRAWLKAINRIIAKHQITNGGGSVIMYQAENEELLSIGEYERYVTKIVDAAKADGIKVPIFHNDYAPMHNWAYNTKRTGLDVYSYDDYPIRFDCSAERQELSDHNWHIDYAFAPTNSPRFIAEAQGGAFTPWGAAFNASDCDKFVDGNFYRQWAALNNGAGVTAFNYYMIFGGTNWGWTGSAHSGFTSYDYGASITEDRNLRTKMSVQKENGYFYRAFPQLTYMKTDTAPPAINVFGGKVKSYQRSGVGMKQYSMSGKGSKYMAFRLDSSNDETLTKFTTTIDTYGPNGQPVTFSKVPQEGQLIIHGRDALQIPIDFKIGSWGAYYSTGLLFLNTVLQQGPTAVLTGTAGDRGEIVLHAPTKPRVKSKNKSVTSVWDKAKKQLRINYDWGFPYEIKVSMKGKETLTLRIADRASLVHSWSPMNLLRGKQQPMLVQNAELVRSVRYVGNTAHLVGSTSKPQTIKLWLPKGITHATWNGQQLPLQQHGTVTTAGLPGPANVYIPRLSWVQKEENFEANPRFDDSKWRVADVKRAEQIRQDKTIFQDVQLSSNLYGFHHGDIWYRAHYTAATDDPELWFKAFGAEGSNFLVWVNGKYVGASTAVKGSFADQEPGEEGSADPLANLVVRPQTATFTLPKGTVKKGQKVVVSILLRNNGQRVDWEGLGNSQHASGILDARLGNSGKVIWKLQGIKGGEYPVDHARGLYNNGGLYGERAGWYLPGFNDSTWRPARTMHARRAGVTWYRSDFTLNFPAGQDVMLRLNVHSKRFNKGRQDDARTVMFINGWNVGTWVGNVGPQKSFTIPAGFLNRNGKNEIAIAVTAEAAGYGPETIQLAPVGNWLGSVPDVPNKAPTYPQLRAHLLAVMPSKRG